MQPGKLFSSASGEMKARDGGWSCSGRLRFRKPHGVNTSTARRGQPRWSHAKVEDALHRLQLQASHGASLQVLAEQKVDKNPSWDATWWRALALQGRSSGSRRSVNETD